jgi:23S rRNA pseudouridine1911/1915/1917 synthase
VSVLYEDEHIIAVNKPTGLLSIASDKMEEDTLHTRVLNYLRSNDSKAWGYIIHRLDRETSGIIIFAKSEQAKESVQTQFAEHQVRRYYTAIVEGEPSEDNGTAKHYLQEDKNLRVWVVEPGSRGAKEAVTHWYVLERNGATSRIELDIETGRRHQIRVQMAEMGHPLVGDRRHESVFDPLGRLCLHATTLQFKHPISGKKLNLDSATPREFDIIASYSIDDMD